MSAPAIRTQPSCRDDTDADSLPVEVARRRILESLSPLEQTQTVALRAALGRTLATDVCSTIDVPAHTNSAMDGYALQAADLPCADTTQLRVVGEALAGHPFSGAVRRGECVRIMTGAPMPVGSDTVVMQEHAERRGDDVLIGSDHRPGQNVRQAGEDLRRGALALAGGTPLTPAHLGLLASLGFAEVQITRSLRVAFFSTGDELRSIGQPIADGEIYDSNRYTLYGMLKRLGVSTRDMGVVPDRRDALQAALVDAISDNDIVITTGGVSVGEADYVKEILADVGQVEFWKIAMKPGRPFAFGRLNGGWFFGLPGNPVAVMVTFYQFVRPAIQRLLGQDELMREPLFELPCLTRLKKRPGRTEFHRGIMERDHDGRLSVRTAGPQGSGILSSMAQANCFIVLPHDAGDVEPGTCVHVQPFYSLV